MKSARNFIDKRISENSRVFGRVILGRAAVVHDGCTLGFPNRDPDLIKTARRRTVTIGSRCIIYPGCFIYEGATLENKVEVHERCTVGSLTRIGAGSMVLYGAQIHDNVTIGKKCIVAGFVADNCSVGDGASIFGALVHRYDSPGRNRWDVTNEKGPTIGKRAVVGWGAVIVGPITIGEDAWIAPNSVVTKDVTVKKRYGEE